MLRRQILTYLCVALTLGGTVAHAGSLEQEASKAFRKIGIGPNQTDRFTVLYDEFLKNRNMQIRRMLNGNSGQEANVLAKKRVRRSAKKSVKQMAEVLDEDQLKYYAEYLEAANKVFLRDAGLR